MKKVLFSIAGWGIGALFGWLVLRGIHWSETVDQLRQVDWSVAFLAVAAVIFAHYLKAYRWKSLLPNEDISPGRLFVVRSAATGLNNLSPVRIFSELAQLALLSTRHRIPAPKVLASLLIQNMQDLLVTSTVLGIGLIALPQLAGYRTVILIIWSASTAVFLAAPFIPRYLLKLEWCCRWRFVQQTLRVAQETQTKPRIVAAGIGLTILGWLYLGVAAWLVSLAVGIDLPFWQIFIVTVAVIRLSGVIPSPPGVVGVHEFVAVSTLGLFAVDPSTALTFALVTHAVIYVPPMIIAGVVMVTERAAFLEALGAVLSPMRQRLTPRVEEAIE